MLDDEFDYISPDFDDEYEEPETWTLISALDRVLNEALESRLSKKFWEKCKNPIDYLTKELSMTRMQVVILAILVENGETMTWKGIAKCVRCSRLNIMTYSNEIDELVEKRWIVRRKVQEFGRSYQGFCLAQGVGGKDFKAIDNPTSTRGILKDMAIQIPDMRRGLGGMLQKGNGQQAESGTGGTVGHPYLRAQPHPPGS